MTVKLFFIYKPLHGHHLIPIKSHYQSSNLIHCCYLRNQMNGTDIPYYQVRFHYRNYFHLFHQDDPFLDYNILFLIEIIWVLKYGFMLK